MLTQFVNTAAVLLAPEPSTEPSAPAGDGSGIFNSDGIQHFLSLQVLPIIVMIIGVGLLFAARNGRVSEVITKGGLTLFAVAIMAGAGLWFAFGENLLKFIIG